MKKFKQLVWQNLKFFTIVPFKIELNKIFVQMFSTDGAFCPIFCTKEPVDAFLIPHKTNALRQLIPITTYFHSTIGYLCPTIEKNCNLRCKELYLLKNNGCYDRRREADGKKNL
jgi:hypothetical protein